MIKLINISVRRTILESLSFKSDTIGAFASGLCMIHCLATPFFFIASACTASCCNNTPFWWQSMDYLFLGISFFAIQQAKKSSTKQWVIQGLGVAWVVLFFLILNIKIELFHVPANFKFIPAFMLVFLHVYNMRYCQCKEKCC